MNLGGFLAWTKSVLSYIVRAPSSNETDLFSKMKLHLTKAEGNQLITGYGQGWIEINTKRYEQSLVVLPNLVVTDWLVTDFPSLSAENFQQLLEYKPEVVLLGTGDKHRFAHPKLTRSLTEAGIGVECMDTAAACRTYNILMSEGRHVAAALLL